MQKFEGLTQHEVEALKQKYNYADVHTHQSQSDSQMEIIKSLPELWLEAEKTQQETLEKRQFVFLTRKMHALVIGLFINRYEFGYQFRRETTNLRHYRILNKK